MLHRLVVTGLLGKQDAQVVQHIRVIGDRLEDRPIKRLCFVVPTLLVERHCTFERLGQCVLIHLSTLTRANLRLPTWTRYDLPTSALRARSVRRSLSTLTPPCSMTRFASDVLSTRPAAF